MSYSNLINFDTSIIYSQFSDEEEDTKRVVRSAKEKRYEELKNTIKQLRNFKKIKDMSSMLSSKYNVTLEILKLDEHA